MTDTRTYATCEDCGREMVPGGSCVWTHVETADGAVMQRLRVGSGSDWGAQAPGENCPDCNAAYGKYHHPGCDVERCPRCGNQMLGCFGEPDDDPLYASCGWVALSRPAR